MSGPTDPDEVLTGDAADRDAAVRAFVSAKFDYDQAARQLKRLGIREYRADLLLGEVLSQPPRLFAYVIPDPGILSWSWYWLDVETGDIELYDRVGDQRHVVTPYTGPGAQA